MVKVKGPVWLLMEPHLTAAECHFSPVAGPHILKKPCMVS